MGVDTSGSEDNRRGDGHGGRERDMSQRWKTDGRMRDGRKQR